MSANFTGQVTLDGPSGTGKSTVARGVASALGLDVLDTGAMYRAVTLLAIEHGLDLGDGDAIARAAERTGLPVDRVTRVFVLDPYFLAPGL